MPRPRRTESKVSRVMVARIAAGSGYSASMWLLASAESVRFRIVTSRKDGSPPVTVLAEFSDGAPCVVAPGSDSVMKAISPQRSDWWVHHPTVA